MDQALALTKLTILVPQQVFLQETQVGREHQFVHDGVSGLVHDVRRRRHRLQTKLSVDDVQSLKRDSQLRKSFYGHVEI